MKSSPTISVIIPTLNAENSIVHLLAMLKHQRPLQLELIVIDSASTDRTADFAEGAGATVVGIKQADFNHGLTRNLGASVASGDIIVFMTQDAVPVDDFTIWHLVEPIVDGRAAAAYARQIPHASDDPIEKFWRHYNYPAEPVIKTLQTAYRRYFFSNVCSAFHKDIFFSLGGFAATEIGEDTLMAYRLINSNYTVAYQSTAEVFHAHDLPMTKKISRYYRIGAFNQAHRYLTVEASHEKDGITAVVKMFGQLWRARQHWYIVIALIDTYTRYLAYTAGRLAFLCGKQAGQAPVGR